MKRIFIILPLISVLYLTFASCSRKYLSINGETWGTFYHIVYSGTEVLDDSIIAELKSIDNEFSLFNPQSTLSRVNRGETINVSPRFRRAFEVAEEVWKASGGRYDVSVGPLSELWGFGSADVTSAPSDSAVRSVLGCVGFGECRIDSSGRVEKKAPGTIFDFASLAKGYGIDCVGKMFERNGVRNYMIEIGGEVLAKGVNPSGRPWRIQIDAPCDGNAHKRLKVVELGPERMAVASSGNYRNFRLDSVRGRYGHTLSPLTGYPVQGNIVGATVIAPECIVADAYATACMAVADADSAAMMCRNAGLGSLITYENQNGCLTTAEDFNLKSNTMKKHSAKSVF